MNAIINAKNFDQFYTKDSVANECLKDLFAILKDTNLLESAAFLEPSAGDGAFLRAIKSVFNAHAQNPKIYAFDIDPKNKVPVGEKIKKADFLSDRIFMESTPKNLITIGNPPFGKRANLAIKFINKAFEYADIVAFILPIHFQKFSAQNKIRKDAKLLFSKVLEEESFLYQGKNYAVRCVFQIWNKSGEVALKDLRLKAPPATQHKDFEMWQYNNTKECEKYFNKQKYGWDFAVARQGYKDYTKKFYQESELDKRTQWIFFKAKNDAILQNLLSLDFEKLSLKNTSTPGFGKADVVGEYVRLFGGAESGLFSEQDLGDAYAKC